VVFLTTAVMAESATPHASAAPTGRVVGPLALGVNLAAWDDIYAHVDAATVAGLLRSSGLALLRYPGGSWADEYDWRTNTDSSNCAGTETGTGPANTATTTSGTCDAVDPLGFGAFSTRARSAGASTFATVNYGSGTPGEAAAWVTRAATAKGEAVALWEVGNETYSCYETNRHLAEAPTLVEGYTPGGSVCPSTAVLARSYAAHAPAYLKAMKRASPTAQIGIPWAFSAQQAGGAGVKDASLWNTKVLSAVKGEISFVDAHWYPFNQVTGVSDQQILLSTRRIPAAAAQIRSTLRRDAPGATFVIGETNVSELPTTLDFQPVSALFAAATSLEWLAQGAESVDWWDLNNFGSPSGGDYGLISSGSPESEPAGTPYPPYYGEQLASALTTSGSRISTLDTGSAKVLGFRSDLGNKREVLLVNTGPSTVSSHPDRWFSPGSTLAVLTYSASTADAPDPIAHSTAMAARSVALPAESIVVLSGAP
jgi:hypothetical protein